MEISPELIQDFFDEKCNAEEAEMVAAYLLSHPELINNYFEDDNKEFASFSLSKAESSYLLKNIKKQTGAGFIQVKTIKRILAIAASIVLIFCCYQLFFTEKKVDNKEIVQNKNIVSTPWKFRINNTDEVTNANLEDGTILHLQPHCFIKYQSFAGQTKRDVYLTGEAFFKVAKDKTKPFTVYAGNLTTTALGTQFNIKDNQQTTVVQLFEGKVVIKSIMPIKSWEKDVYLTPGEQLIFNKKNNDFIIKPIGDTSQLNDKTSIKKNNFKIATTAKNSNWFMFNNQSLNSVFEQLQEIYNIKIEYKNIDIKNVYFIGRFEKTDSVTTILNNIALLKKLHIEHRSNTYFITKK